MTSMPLPSPLQLIPLINLRVDTNTIEQTSEHVQNYKIFLTSGKLHENIRNFITLTTSNIHRILDTVATTNVARCKTTFFQKSDKC